LTITLTVIKKSPSDLAHSINDSCLTTQHKNYPEEEEEEEENLFAVINSSIIIIIIITSTIIINNNNKLTTTTTWSLQTQFPYIQHYLH